MRTQNITRTLMLTLLIICFIILFFKYSQPSFTIKLSDEAEVTSIRPAPIMDLPVESSQQFDCMESADNCLQAITSKSGNAPILQSFKEDTTVHTHHSKTGKKFLAPNVVHMCRFGENYEFDFQQYVSFVGVHKFIKPTLIVIWGDFLPPENCTWWIRALKEVPNVYYVHTLPAKVISGETVQYIAHSSDFLRLLVLKDYGGIYLDNDVIPVKSFDDVRVYPISAGRASVEWVNNGILAAEPNNLFVNSWIEAYGSYNPQKFLGNNVVIPAKLADIYPHLIHLEPRNFLQPLSPTQMYEENYDFSQNYCIHLHWEPMNYIPDDEEELQGYDCTLGDVMRYVLYGNMKLLDTENITNGTTKRSGDKKKKLTVKQHVW